MILREIISSLRALLPFLGKGSIYMGTPSSLPLIQQWAAEGRGHAASSSTGAADFELNHVCQFRSQRGRGHGQDQDGQVGGVGVGGLLQRPSQRRRLEALESGPWSKSPTWAGTHLRPYRAATKEEGTKRIELKYKSGGMWISRIFARVASGKRNWIRND